MLNGRIYTYGSQGSIFQRIVGILAFLIIVGLCLYLFYHIYILLFYASPLFIVAALIIYPGIVSSHLKMIGSSFRQNPIGGLLELGLQIVGLPIVSLGLLVKAWAYKKFGQLKDEFQKNRSAEDTFVQYEEVKEEKPSLPSELSTDNKNKTSNSYDDLFE